MTFRLKIRFEASDHGVNYLKLLYLFFSKFGLALAFQR
jgi:hypothetical protein